MDYICPVCNGLIQQEMYCKKCRCNMRDGGRVQDYYDDYSPYLSYGITDVMDGEPSNICQHLFTCPQCGFDEVTNINKVIY